MNLQLLFDVSAVSSNLCQRNAEKRQGPEATLRKSMEKLLTKMAGAAGLEGDRKPAFSCGKNHADQSQSTRFLNSSQPRLSG